MVKISIFNGFAGFVGFWQIGCGVTGRRHIAPHLGIEVRGFSWIFEIFIGNPIKIY